MEAKWLHNQHNKSIMPLVPSQAHFQLADTQKTRPTLSRFLSVAVPEAASQPQPSPTAYRTLAQQPRNTKHTHQLSPAPTKPHPTPTMADDDLEQVPTPPHSPYRTR